MFSQKFFNHQIDIALSSAPIIDSAHHQRIVIFSDCHRGSGNWSDSFLPNKTIYEAALTYYFNNGFTYIELGDGDELWENRNFTDIAEIHSDTFRLLERFADAGRMFIIWGNHDRVKSRNFRYGFTALPAAHEGLIIRCSSTPGHGSYHLIHGHQADPLNNQFWKIARWLVRYIWRPLELSGFKDPTSTAKNYDKGKIVEQRLLTWCRTNSVSLVAGHTHRPVLAGFQSDNSNTHRWRYCNTGSCIHPNTITCIEMDHGNISLIKWATCADASQYIHVCRHIIGGPYEM